MAKDKKRGFFSWFGRGRQKEETRVEKPGIEENSPETTGIAGIEEQPVAAEPEIEHAEAPGVPVENHPGEWDVTSTVEAAAEIEPAFEPVHEIPAPAAEPQPVAKELASVQLAEDIVAVTEQVAFAQHEPVAEEFVESDVEIAADVRQDALDVIDDSLAEEPLPVALDPIITLPAVETEQERPTKEGFFARLKRSLVKTKENLGSGFVGLFRGKKIDDDLFEELEEQLIIADVGVETTRKIITSLTEHASRKQLKDADALYGKLKEEMSEILAKVDQPLDVSGKTPFVILMVGVNGVGKTTTIGKMARQFEAQGKSVMLAAGDTFRAAAVEQLQIWGQRNKIPVIAQHTGADSASVIFDAIQAAKARGIDVLIA